MIDPERNIKAVWAALYYLILVLIIVAAMGVIGIYGTMGGL
jgi:hypothetical protein